MKTLKFNHYAVKAIIRGQKVTTWRINDDKDIAVDDDIEFVDSDELVAFGTAIVDEVTSKRLGDITSEDYEGHESYTSVEAMYKQYEQYYGPNIQPSTEVKIIKFRFKPYTQPKKLISEDINNSTKLREVKIYADGGSRGNPGPSASGYVLMDMDNNVVKKEGLYLGITTNNQAEYQALRLGLEEAKRLGAVKVNVYMDSLLVVNQMKGIFKVKNRELWEVHDDIQKLVLSFKQISFTHVPRELNKLADTMVNETLDAQIFQK